MPCTIRRAIAFKDAGLTKINYAPCPTMSDLFGDIRFRFALRYCKTCCTDARDQPGYDGRWRPAGLAMAAGVQMTLGAAQIRSLKPWPKSLRQDHDRSHQQRADPTDASPDSASCGRVNKYAWRSARIWGTAAATQHVDHASDACSIGSVTPAI